MATQDDSNWLYNQEFDDIHLNRNKGFSWTLQPFSGSNNAGVEAGGSFVQPEVPKIAGSKKRCRNNEACAPSRDKACREKQRRDRLNDKFLELAALLEPGKPPKTDKSAILCDALRLVTKLRDEARKLKDVNSNLKDKIKELKAEKSELRDEKQRLKAEKEKLEHHHHHQLKTQPNNNNVPPQQQQQAFAAPQSQGVVNKLVPLVGYPGVAMWQFLPPATVDTSQDHVLRPPVA